MKVDKIERLTAEQMKEKYPNQWLGLQNVKFKNDDGINVEEGDVVYINETADSTLRMRVLDGIDIVRWDTFDEVGPELLYYEVHKPVDEE